MQLGRQWACQGRLEEVCDYFRARGEVVDPRLKRDGTEEIRLLSGGRPDGKRSSNVREKESLKT